MKLRSPFLIVITASVLAGCGAFIGLGDVPDVSLPAVDSGMGIEAEAAVAGMVDPTKDSAKGDEGDESSVASEPSNEASDEAEAGAPLDSTVLDARDSAPSDVLSEPSEAGTDDAPGPHDGDLDTTIDGREVGPESTIDAMGDASDDHDATQEDVGSDGPTEEASDSGPESSIDVASDQDASDWLGAGIPEEVFPEVDYHGGMLLGGPTVTSWGTGRLDVLAIGVDNALYHTSFDISSGWQNGWDALGGGLTSDPAATSFAKGRIDGFSRGANYGVWHLSRDPSYPGNGWSGWQNLSGTFASGPAASSWGGGRIDIFGVGGDNALYHKWYDPTAPGTGWSGDAGQPDDPAGWYSRGGFLTSDPAAASWGPNRIDVFALGADHSVQHASRDAVTGHWSWDPRGLGGSFATRPSVSSQGPGRLDVFVVGPSSTPASTSVYHRSYDATTVGWTGWMHVADSATQSGPASASWGPGRIDLFSIGAESSCQKAADFYGIVRPGSWGFAPTDVQTWWNQSGCNAASTASTLQLCQNASDLYAIVSAASAGGADAQTLAWWNATGCSATPSCQRISDLFGLSTGPTGYAPSYVVNWWQNVAGCSTAPMFAPATRDANCQRASDRFGIVAGKGGAPTDFGFAPSYVQTWWKSAQPPACNASPGSYVLKHFGKGP